MLDDVFASEERSVAPDTHIELSSHIGWVSFGTELLLSTYPEDVHRQTACLVSPRFRRLSHICVKFLQFRHTILVDRLKVLLKFLLLGNIANCDRKVFAFQPVYVLASLHRFEARLTLNKRPPC